MKAGLVLVAAVAENGVIGAAGGMPWHLSSDLKRFRAITTGHPVLMGRKTYASIGRPLPGRDTIVVTRDAAFAADGVIAAPSLEAGLEIADGKAAERGVAAIMVIGGGEIFSALIGQAAALRITEVHAVPDGDVLFPAIDPALWRETERSGPVRGERDSAPVSFVDYVRRVPLAAPTER
ncbi:dihydrofolate reductase [Segnochrobactrum spirostomi]|uniref:Dihydrofolate reductase n=1 Tax=Segnochrobactrum spirostomi TaxID=2608987 RepID=A0A6A7XZI0_9HYPH|nr:dihydrofolate reductase [Segnochrobactrum spirostomi]MQT11527.1 dihydrofolate reductase [Segnochrobactrum spirostomi]